MRLRHALLISQRGILFAINRALFKNIWSLIGVWAGGAGGAAAPPESGKIIFFGQSSNFSGSGQKMKNNIIKIINEKYEKYSIGYSKIKCPKSELFGMRHLLFGRWPIFFGQNRSSPPPKMVRTPMWSLSKETYKDICKYFGITPMDEQICARESKYFT